MAGGVEGWLGAGVIGHVYADGGILSGADITQNGRHHLVQRHRCPNLVIGHPAQQRVNGLDVIKDAAEFLRCLGERVAGPGRQPLNQRLEPRAQQIIWSNCAWNCTWFSSQPATNRTSASSVASSASMASSRHI